MESIGTRYSIYTPINDVTKLRIIPSLAEQIGLDESIVLMQIEYWIGISNNLHDGKYWTYQSLKDMQEKAFKWWSITTISRIIKRLAENQLIFVGNYNQHAYDKTQWFALNPDGLKQLDSVVIMGTEVYAPSEPLDSNIFQNEKSILQNEKSIFQNETTIPYTTTYNTTENKEEIHAPATQDAPSPKVKKAPHPIHQRNVEGQNPYFNAICYFCWGTPYQEWTEADKTARSKGKGGGRVGKILAQLQLDYDALGGFTAEQFEAALKAWAIDNHTTPVHMRPRDAGKFHDAIAPILKAIVTTASQKIVTLPTETTPATDWREHARLAQLRKENGK